MPTDRDIIFTFDNLYAQDYYAWNPSFAENETDMRFFLGEQWNEKEKKNLYDEGRSTFVFNRIRRNINLVSGYQRKNRLSSVVVPIENSDQKTADQLTKLLFHVMNYCDGYHVISNCFSGALKTGWNLCSVWLDYREDPINGDIRLSREPFNAFITDPYFFNLDFSDCSHILRRKYLGLDQAQSLLPGQEKEVLRLQKQGWERDDKFTWLPYQMQPNGQDLLAYNEMYQQKWKKVPILVDNETGEFFEFDVADDRMNYFIKQFPQMQMTKMPKRYIEKHVIVNAELMRTEINPFGLNEYPFTPIAALWEPEASQWELKLQSLVRCMRDPQKEANRRRSQMIDVLDSQINSGWIATEDSVVNPRSLFQSAQGRVIWRKQDAQPGALEKIPPAQIPPSMFQLQELFDRDMVEIAGINDAAFGVTENAQESGVMMMLRQGAAVVSLQDIFDNLRLMQKTVCTKILKLIQGWTPEKVKRILNEEPSEQFYKKDFTKYDVRVVEGLLTDNQQQMYFRQLVELKQMGVPVTGEMLAKAAPIQGKSEFSQEIAAIEKQQAQAAQQQQQIQAQVLQTQSQMAQAKAVSDIALSKERYTRGIANLGLENERNAKAVENRAQIALDRIKAIKELQTIDDDRLIKYLSMVQMMEQMTQAKEERTKMEDVMISQQGGQPQNPMQNQNPSQNLQQPPQEVKNEPSQI